jgi:hypothetical protein
VEVDQFAEGGGRVGAHERRKCSFFMGALESGGHVRGGSASADADSDVVGAKVLGGGPSCVQVVFGVFDSKTGSIFSAGEVGGGKPRLYPEGWGELGCIEHCYAARGAGAEVVEAPTSPGAVNRGIDEFGEDGEYLLHGRRDASVFAVE